MNRMIIKGKGKEAFKRNYWHCVLVAFILSILTASYDLEYKSDESHAVSIQSISQKVTSLQFGGILEDAKSDVGKLLHKAEDFLLSPIFAGVAIVGAVIAAVASVLTILFRIFVTQPLEVGGARFFLSNTDEERAPISLLLYAFQQGEYLGIVKAMFFRALYIFLWSLLFVIPGIVKAYQYRMVSYLLAENPTLDTREALERSREIMAGRKMDTFIYDLSFIGWWILSVITWNIVGVFYVAPYKNASDAQLYLTFTQKEYSNYTDYREIPE